MKHIAIGLGLVALLSIGKPDVSAYEQAKAPDSSTTYSGRTRCGVTDVFKAPPYAKAAGDVDGDGVVEEFYANATAIHQHVYLKDGFHEILLIHRSYAGAHWYGCADLQLRDLDDDGDLDMAYANSKELRTFENDGKGNFKPKQDWKNDLDARCDVRIRSVRKLGKTYVDTQPCK